MWRDAFLIMQKDLNIELKSKVVFNQVIPFGLVVILLFGLAIGKFDSSSLSTVGGNLSDAGLLKDASAGLFWMAVTLSAVIGVQRSFAIETQDQARDALRLSALDPAGIFLGKAGALLVELAVLESVLALCAIFLFGMQIAVFWLFLAASCLATIALSAVGVIYGALASGARTRETLLPLLFFPVIAPVLLSATKACEAAIVGQPSSGMIWIEVLAVFSLCYIALGVAAFGSLLEE
ncbi:MAG: heme exporter protein CcmB [Firmicutes bacterium]|nr:heme exporter protein CcmB [Bacillota bacterium]